jgi:adenine-specific DNA glycosylase
VEAAHRHLEAEFPPETYYAAHLNLIRLGREVCHPRKPDCPHCPIRDLCDAGRAGTFLSSVVSSPECPRGVHFTAPLAPPAIAEHPRSLASGRAGVRASQVQVSRPPTTTDHRPRMTDP